MSYKLKNPLLPGFYPDPSICRVKDDFYMITSSFSYFPGIPVFHSRDLAHWEQIGYALDRPSQLPLSPYDISGGIYAPTLRYHDGIFYIITTNVMYMGNFIITAENINGPWSEPHYLKDAEGYDPSLFWDDNGKAYFIASHTQPLAASDDQPVIYISEIDLNTFSLIGEKTDLWKGSLAEPIWPEAPHIYKVNGYFYLLIAEGETEHFHSVSIARSKELCGPYTSYRGNPILTQRYLGMEASIANVGHADLIELEDNTWYAVFLGSRPYGGYHKNLGRETFIAPVKWEEGWPVINPGLGVLQFEYDAPDLPEFTVKNRKNKDDFDTEKLDFCWNILGTPDESTYKLEDGYLKIQLSDLPLGRGMRELKIKQGENLDKPLALGFIGRRQQHMSFLASAKLCFNPKDNQTAGIAALQNAYQQLRIELALTSSKEKVIRAVKGFHSLEPSFLHKDDSGKYNETILKQIPWSDNEAVIQIEAQKQQFTLSVLDSGGNKIILSREDGSFLGSETAGGFVGTYLGMFASGNGQTYPGEYASFDWFIYENTDNNE